MIDVKHKRCEEDGCDERAYFGRDDGAYKVRTCKQHKDKYGELFPFAQASLWPQLHFLAENKTGTARCSTWPAFGQSMHFHLYLSRMTV